MDASSFYTDKYDEELMISVKTSEECNGPASLKYIKNLILELQYIGCFYWIAT